MILFKSSLDAWRSPQFSSVLKREVEMLPPAQLPLQEGLRLGSVALEDGVSAVILGSEELESVIRVRAMIFYSSVIAGCSCADDPTPVDTCHEQCTVQIDIDKQSAGVTIALSPD
ncbi:hypothetical protein FEF65_11255 [Mariprofundus erugo]|uniref:Uncharacterized protein n=1 Tax=Mariprofundus erugo TaxID=2528639 RepID=A0A5R9GQA8_9PROT|nr:hypothetical protein [Mariprofundus erugo]TLS66162.1 hypothetical protein FEF65_11255 [Mariprofundus erugo]